MPTRSSASVTKCFAVAGARSAIRQRQFDVLENREVADQIETLEDETDFAIPDSRALRERKIRDFVTFQRVTAVGRSIQQTENRQAASILPQPDGPAMEIYSPSRMSR